MIIILTTLMIVWTHASIPLVETVLFGPVRKNVMIRIMTILTIAFFNVKMPLVEISISGQVWKIVMMETR